LGLSSITRDSLGRENSDTFTLASGQTIKDQIVRATSGDIVSGIENGVAKSYTYDQAGRLTAATLGANTFSYGFATADTACNGLSGNNPNTGKNGNRTKMTINGVTTTYCYDQADRLIASSDPTLTTPTYDTHGNMLSLGDATRKTIFSYDTSDRNIGIKSGTGTTAKDTTFARDVQGRVIQRTAKTNNIVTSDVSYGFTGSGDTPDFLMDATGSVTQKYLTLPGDIIATIKPGSTSAGATTYSLPNIHGDVMATINADGALISSAHMTGPFGEVLSSQISPANTTPGTTWDYVGQHQKLTDLDTSPIAGGIIQMGARVYIPTLGRFLSVDPIDGAGDNAYSYVNDPVNENDLDGKIAPLVAFAAWQLGRIAVQQTLKIAAQHAARQAVQQVAKKTVVHSTKKVVQTQARTLSQKLTLKEVRANPRVGTHIMKNKTMGDPRFSSTDWRKMQYTHRALTSRSKNVTVHYFHNQRTNAIKQLKIMKNSRR